jgi:hypothetical protein
LARFVACLGGDVLQHTAATRTEGGYTGFLVATSRVVDNHCGTFFVAIAGKFGPLTFAVEGIGAIGRDVEGAAIGGRGTALTTAAAVTVLAVTSNALVSVYTGCSILLSRNARTVCAAVVCDGALIVARTTSTALGGTTNIGAATLGSTIATTALRIANVRHEMRGKLGATATGTPNDATIRFNAGTECSTVHIGGINLRNFDIQRAI